MSKSICPFCNVGMLEAKTEMSAAEYGGVARDLLLLFSECDHCGSEISNAEQSRANKRAMMAFKKSVDGLLLGTEVRALRGQLGVTQAQAAQIFGGGPVAFSKYESDDVMQSEAMDKLLRLAASVSGAFEHLAQAASLDLLSPQPVWQDVEMPTEAEPCLKQRGHLRLVRSQIFTPESQRQYA